MFLDFTLHVIYVIKTSMNFSSMKIRHVHHLVQNWEIIRIGTKADLVTHIENVWKLRLEKLQ